MNKNQYRELDLMMTRRQLFGRTALGLGTAAMANLLGTDLLAAAGTKAGMHHPANHKQPKNLQNYAFCQVETKPYCQNFVHQDSPY